MPIPVDNVKQLGTILAVDDTLASLKVLTSILKDNGYQVRSADSGRLALAYAMSNPLDLVLLDIRMPGLDGFEVCRQLSVNPKTRDIPVIFLSAITDVAERVEGFKCGAVDFVSKPFQSDELLARVHTHLKLRNLQKYIEQRSVELQRTNEDLELEIKKRVQFEAERERLIAELQSALADIKTLRGIIPICCHCKKIRDDQGFWNQVESYVSKHSLAQFSHGMCPDCMKKYFPDFAGEE